MKFYACNYSRTKNSLDSAKTEIVDTDHPPPLPSPIEVPERIQPNATSASAAEPIAKETDSPQFPTRKEMPGVTNDYPSIYSLRNHQQRKRKTPTSRHKSLRPLAVLRRAKQTERRTLRRTKFEQKNPTWKRQRQRQRQRSRQRQPMRHLFQPQPLEADYRHRLPSPRDTNY